MGGCAAIGCTNSSRKGFVMTHFPKEPDRRQEWLDNMKRVRWKPTENSCLCHVHFEDDMWENDNKKKLKRNAVPTLFMFAERPMRKRRKLVVYNYDDSPSEEEQVNTSKSSSSSKSISSPSSGSSSSDSSNGRSDSSHSSEPKVTSTVATGAPQVQSREKEKVFNPFSHKTNNSPAAAVEVETDDFVNKNYPVHQDVKLAKLPFYEVLAELLKPSSLIPSTNASRLQEKTFYFYFTPQQVRDITNSRIMTPDFIYDYEKQVQLRFCLSETICDQEDFFPPGLVVKINNRILTLPNFVATNKIGVEPKRPPKPLNITTLVKLSSTSVNSVKVTWANEYGPVYTVTVNLVRKLTSFDLVQKLKEKGAMNSDYTRSLIKEKLNEDVDSEIMTTCLRVSLLCPLGKIRMSCPCRANTCKHLQCFDSSLFLQMNEKKPTWSCPVCDKAIQYDNLIIDGYFKEVLASSKLPSEINEIELKKDGSWSIRGQGLDSSTCQNDAETIEIFCDEGEEIRPASTKYEPSTSKSCEIVDLLDSDSDEEMAGAFQSPNSIIDLDSPSPSSPCEHNTNKVTSELINNEIPPADGALGTFAQEEACCSSTTNNFMNDSPVPPPDFEVFSSSTSFFPQTPTLEPSFCTTSDALDAVHNPDNSLLEPKLDTVILSLEQDLPTTNFSVTKVNENDVLLCLPPQSLDDLDKVS